MSLKGNLRFVHKQPAVRYAASLPERIVRAAAALAGGLVRELATVVLPAGLRRGRLYRNLVDATLQFVIEDVGQVPANRMTEQQLRENFLLRRAAGNGIELMGIVAFRASPVWVLAALADVAGFGRQIIPEIAAALRKEGLLDSDESFATVEQLLHGLELGSAQLAETVNTPPLDVAELRREWAKLAATARRLPSPQLPSLSAVTGLWQDLRATAAEEQRSVFEVSSLLALSAATAVPRRARLLSRSATLALHRSGTVLAGSLLDHYRESLAELKKTGFLRYGIRQLTPYTHAALGAFAPRRETTTSTFLDKL